MSYQATITPTDKYLHVVVSGTANFQNAQSLWHAIATAAKQHNCFNILGEQFTRNTISATDAWNHQKIFLEAGINSKYKIAWVDKNPRTLESTQFIRTVLRNRHIGFGKVFGDTELARSWLDKKISGIAFDS